MKINVYLFSEEDLDANVDMLQLSLATDGMSGSDIKEYCSQSCMVRYREIFRYVLLSGFVTCC